MSDARFEDASPKPLRLLGQNAEDVEVFSALVQDAVFPATEMRYETKARRFVMLLNRFRWEDRIAAPERVQAVLAIGDVMAVASDGVQRGDADAVLSLLSVTFEPGEDGSGALVLTLAGDGAIRLEVEALDLQLRDVTRPYGAPSGQRPSHPE